jgi:hypothetical protein
MTAILRDRGFWIAAGAAFAVLVVLVALRALSSRWWEGAGVVTTVGALIGVAAVFRVPVELVAGVAVLGVAGLVAARSSRVVGVAVAVPGAALVALAVGETSPASPDWVRIVAGSAAGVTALLSRDFDETSPRLTGVCLAVAAVGVYATVPDTEAARALVGAAGVSALLGLASDLRPSPVGSSAVAGVIAWNVGVGGWPRPGAVVGGVACVGVLALGPLLRWVRTPPASIVAVHVVLVAIVARVAGLRERAVAAAVIAALAYLGATLVLLGTGQPRSRPRRRHAPPRRSPA